MLDFLSGATEAADQTKVIENIATAVEQLSSVTDGKADQDFKFILFHFFSNLMYYKFLISLFAFIFITKFA